MLKKLLRGIFSVIGLIIGYFISEILLTISPITNLTYLSTTIGRGALLLLYVLFLDLYCILFLLLYIKVFLI